ncbi:MAG TPA: fasciclin domain-containing protein [Noviherbaspirillum sp.]|uniref:fasciclin domain-containing protein n=1 Tax=Noviherbaspirillum sp. TaxID=1926288 RepID=UPI002F91E500
MKAYGAAVATVLMLGVTSAACAADLVETARTSGSLKTFMQAAQTAGMADKLKNSGPYTVFAPSDSAFKQLPPEKVAALLKDKEKAAQLVAYHVIPGAVTVADVKPGKVQTMQGSPVTLTSDNGSVTVENAKVIQSDLKADNGVIHEIDQVVLPPE